MGKGDVIEAGKLNKKMMIQRDSENALMHSEYNETVYERKR